MVGVWDFDSGGLGSAVDWEITSADGFRCFFSY